MEGLQKNIWLTLDFFKALFLALQFFYYTLMTFLMMLSVTLASRLMVLLYTLNVNRGRKWLVDFNARKTHLVLFDWFNKTAAIDVKMNVSVLEEKSSLRCWG